MSKTRAIQVLHKRTMIEREKMLRRLYSNRAEDLDFLGWERVIMWRVAPRQLCLFYIRRLVYAWTVSRTLRGNGIEMAYRVVVPRCPCGASS